MQLRCRFFFCGTLGQLCQANLRAVLALRIVDVVFLLAQLRQGLVLFLLQCGQAVGDRKTAVASLAVFLKLCFELRFLSLNLLARQRPACFQGVLVCRAALRGRKRHAKQ